MPIATRYNARMVHTLLIALITCSIIFPGCVGFAARERDGITRLGYSIQVGAFKEVQNAERLALRLQKKGIEAFYFKKDDGLYAVRFGDYAAHNEARSTARKLVASKMIDSFFIAVPQNISLRKNDPEPRSTDPRPVKTRPADDMGRIAARTAERFVGIPYRWGGDNVVDGMDCSGFARAVYNLCGVNIPRASREQYRVGVAVEKEDLADGDLVFFGAASDQINHVGIYVGNGNFVHAPRRGADIKISSLDEAYFVKKFIGAKRYF